MVSACLTPSSDLVLLLLAHRCVSVLNTVTPFSLAVSAAAWALSQSTSVAAAIVGEATHFAASFSTAGSIASAADEVKKRFLFWRFDVPFDAEKAAAVHDEEGRRGCTALVGAMIASAAMATSSAMSAAGAGN